MNEEEKVGKEVNKVFPEESGLESLGKSLMNSWQNRRNVMKIRDRYYEASSIKEKYQIYDEFIKYVEGLSEEDRDEAGRTWNNPNDPWYNPGKSI